MPTQEKKKGLLSPRHLRRWGVPWCPHKEKKRNISLKNRSEENKINHNKQRNLGVILLRNSKREYYQNLSVENICDKFLESS